MKRDVSGLESNDMFRSGRRNLAFWLLRRPMAAFILQCLILIPLIVVPDPALVVGPYVFVLPWLLPILGILNLPLVAGVFRAFRLDPATKRNHTLEHATILCLEESSGRRFAGRAARNGFRLCGNASVPEIRTAFERVRRAVRNGNQLSYISRRCGSNIVTAFGSAVGLLWLVLVVSVAFRPPLTLRATALAVVVLLPLLLRRGLGNAMQRRFFTAVDFGEVSLKDIRKVRRQPFDRGPVHFVETIVRPRATVPFKQPGKPTSGADADVRKR